ncbi:Uncharacterized protein APZ42_015777 [Daphnia magna]|uniref:Uncharacterized protein n=1 Tax=Daphnia magna TaxID=35525 RepID=A0A0N8D4N5_9CRUS|nr:Uncharacterized protein APZ42_015777 [Daphnia magna]
MQNQCRAKKRKKGLLRERKPPKFYPPFFIFLSLFCASLHLFFLFPRSFLTMLFLLSCKS